MEDVLDALAAYLAAYSTGPYGTLQPSDVQWILGDIGMGRPQQLPWGYIAPFNDAVAPSTTGGSSGGTRGVDMDTFQIPMLLVDDLHKYGEPIQVDGQAYYEQPGYRNLLHLAQNVRHAMRENITLDGLIATSRVSEIRYVRVEIADKVYRAARVTTSMQQRRGR